MRRLRGAWLGLGVLAYFVASLAWLDRARPYHGSEFVAGSVDNVSPNGLSLAYRYLRSRGGAGVLARPLDLESVPAAAVVFRVQPAVSPEAGRQDPEEDEEKAAGSRKPPRQAKPRRLLGRAEEAWVRGGGRLVLALAESWGPAEVEVAAGAQARPQKVFPQWKGVSVLHPEPRRSLAGPLLDQGHALFLLGDRPMIARVPLGRGEIVLLAAPEMLENARLGLGDHLALLEVLAGPDRPVYFDEHAHGVGSEPGLLDLLLRLGFGPLLLAASALSLLGFWRARKRLGPAVDAYRETRSDAVDLLDSLGEFYDRSLRRDEAAFLYREALARTVTSRTGLRGPALESRLAELVGTPARLPERQARDLPAAGFASTLKGINDAFRRLQP